MNPQRDAASLDQMCLADQMRLMLSMCKILFVRELKFQKFVAATHLLLLVDLAILCRSICNILPHWLIRVLDGQTPYVEVIANCKNNVDHKTPVDTNG